VSLDFARLGPSSVSEAAPASWSSSKDERLQGSGTAVIAALSPSRSESSLVSRLLPEVVGIDFGTRSSDGGARRLPDQRPCQ
jgi:hypothetical protein